MTLTALEVDPIAILPVPVVTTTHATGDTASNPTVDTVKPADESPRLMDDDDDDDDDEMDMDEDSDADPLDRPDGEDTGFNDGLEEDDEIDEFDDIDEDDFDDDFDDDFEEELDDDYEIEIDDEISAEFGLNTAKEPAIDLDDGDDFDDFEEID